METLYRKYKRTQTAEMRPVKEQDINSYTNHGFLHISNEPFGNNVSISDADKTSGSPKIGDMIARNPKNHLDQWLVAEQYFKDNFEAIEDDNPIQKLEADKEELLDALGLHNPWSLTEIVQKLIEGNKILLHKHSYDGHGWEFHNKAIEEGEKAVSQIESIIQKHKQ